MQCGCSQLGLPGGDFVGISLASCPQPHTPDLIPGGAQAAEPLLPHQPPDRSGVSQQKKSCGWNTESDSSAIHSIMWCCCISNCFCVMCFLFFNHSSCCPCLFQPPCMSRSVVLSSGAEQGDEVAVLNGCQEEHKTSSAKVQHAYECKIAASVYLSVTPLTSLLYLKRVYTFSVHRSNLTGVWVHYYSFIKWLIFQP